MDVYLVRHGESTHNQSRLFTGMTDAPLTERGRQQARDLAPLLSGIRFSGVYSSDLSRAYETCRLLVGEQTPITTDEQLREMHFGIYEGEPYAKLDEAFFEEREESVDRIKQQMPGGESIKEMYDRVNRAYETLIARHQPGDQILITAHGGPLRAILSRALWGSIEGYWSYPIDNATLNHLRYEEGTAKPILCAMNEKSEDPSE